jgi:putative ABC transport system permease protein
VKARIETVLRERRHIRGGAADDFHVRDMAEILKTVSGATFALTALLAAIGGISLLVGGIGIMNIMLVSVTERTREIGLRLAIGARGADIRTQFLVEAVVLAILGGALGVVLGLSGGYGATWAFSLPFTVEPWVIALAFVFCAGVGVLFGFYPAHRAAKLDPIEALRHE